MNIPQGYELITRSCPYWDLVGPFYAKPVEGGGAHIGLRVEPKHGNMRGVAQGGLIATLADIALGFNIAAAGEGRETRIATVNLTTDFVGAAKIGEWLEARVDVQRVGRLSFANTYIHVGERRIARVSGVFSAVSR